jgi:hypothetical protein
MVADVIVDAFYRRLHAMAESACIWLIDLRRWLPVGLDTNLDGNDISAEA